MTNEPHPSYIGDQVTWDRDRLVVTSPALLARIDKPYLSASTAKAMDQCPAGMVGKKAIPERFDLFAANSKGSAAHEVLETMYQLPPERRDATHATKILVDMANREPSSWNEVNYAREIGSDPVRYASWIAAITKGYSGIFAIEDPKAVQVHSIEMKLDGIEIAGVPFKGFIDRVEIMPDGTFKVVDYKGLAMDTPIPTPTGWTTMGDLEVGDEVFGSAGTPVRVTIKSAIHHRPCYRVSFNDGTSVVCDNVHLWQVDDNVRGGAGRDVISADDLYALVSRRKSEGHPFSVTIPNVKALELPEAAVPLDPYILGAWLSDGRTTGSTITVGLHDLPDMLVLLKDAWRGTVQVEDSSIERAYALDSAPSVTLTRKFPDRCGLGHEPDFGTSPRPGRADVRQCRECSRLRAARRRAGDVFAIRGSDERWNVPLRTVLKDAALLGDKHIPAAYLRGSLEQRISLLQGLMDTDGHWSEKRGSAVFVTTLPRLAEQVFELVSSLGVLANRSVGKPAREGAKTPYRVVFRPVGFNPFRLPRKAFLVDSVLSTYSTARASRRVVTDVERVESVPTQCIQVDAPDALYACGTGFSLCHNTGKDKSKPNLHYGDDHGDQGRLYKSAFETATGETVKHVYMYYIEHGKMRRVAIGKTDVRKTERAFAASWTSLRSAVEKAEFVAKPSNLCGWCPLANACPVAKAAKNPDDPRGSAATAVELGIPVMREVEAPVAQDFTGVDLTLREPPPEYDDPYAGLTGTQPPPDVPAELIDAAVHVTLHAPAGAARVSGEDIETNPEGPTTMNVRREGKAWEPMTPDGLNLNSYAAMGVIGLSALSAELLSANDQKVGPSTLRALTAVLAKVVLNAQATVTNGSRDWSEGANTRVRGALRTFIESGIAPLPFGGTRENWDAWSVRATGFSVALVQTGIALFDDVIDTTDDKVMGALYAQPAPVAAVA